MAQQNNSLIKWKPTRFMMNLAESTTRTMAKMAQYTAQDVEKKHQAYRQVLDDIDSYDRSLKFFQEEYDGADKERHIATVTELKTQANMLLNTMSEPKSLRTLYREHAEACKDHIVMMLATLKVLFLVDRQLSNEACFIVAEMIVAEYPALTMEELAVCFNNAIKGKYGEDFQRMDAPTILKWVKIFAKEKYDRLKLEQQNKELHYKAFADHGRAEGKDNQQKLQEAISHMQTREPELWNKVK